ncbi:MAG: hypothetical protein K9J17_02245 [Flavobacteriales bacterium]|nr:hypothetical protein [Flavobacteriales bacterium]
MANTHLIEEITKLTMKLKKDHPDVFEHLDENPITLKFTSGQGADESELHEYLETLKDLLEKHGS